MASVKDLLFSSIRASLGQEIDISDVPSDEELRELYRLSKAQDMAHLVSYAMGGKGLLDGNTSAREAFKKQENLAIFRNTIMLTEYSRICSTLESEMIPYVPLKGAIIRSMYPKPWMRTSCDIDVLVHEEDLNRAIAALKDRCGYTLGEREYHDVTLNSDSGVHLELHFSIKENTERIDPLLERVWEYATAVDGKCMHRLSDEFFIFYHAAHMYYHFRSGGCGVKALVDLYLLERHVSPNEEILASMLDQTGILKFYHAMTHLARALFSGGEYTELDCEIESFILTGGVYGTVESKVTAARTEGGKKRSYFLLRAFPPFSVLSVRYPIIKKYKILTPVFTVVRWFDIFSPKKRKKILNQLSASGTLTEGELDRSRQLFDSLGI